MKYSIIFAAVLVALATSACEKQTVPTPTVVTVPVPGPAGPTGATGATGSTGGTGATGEQGKTGGDTVVVIPPAPAR